MEAALSPGLLDSTAISKTGSDMTSSVSTHTHTQHYKGSKINNKKIKMSMTTVHLH